MRFSPPSQKMQTVLLLPIIIPVVVCVVPIAVCVAPIAYPLSKFLQWVERRRKAKGKHRWFAWHPVEMHGFYYDRKTDYAWLEYVDRTWRNGWDYCYPDELNRWERYDQAQEPKP